MILKRGQIICRHYQFADWFLDLVIANFRGVIPLYSVVEEREGRVHFHASERPYHEAEPIYRERANGMSRQAGLECEIEGVTKTITDANAFHGYVTKENK